MYILTSQFKICACRWIVRRGLRDPGLSCVAPHDSGGSNGCCSGSGRPLRLSERARPGPPAAAHIWREKRRGRGRGTAVSSSTWPVKGRNIRLKSERCQTFRRDPRRSLALTRREREQPLGKCSSTVGFSLSSKQLDRRRCRTQITLLLSNCLIK